MTVIRRKTFTRLGSAAAVLGAGLALAACGSSSGSSSQAAPPTPSASGASATGLSIATSKGSDGTYLVGPDGRALYLWVADSHGKSSCSGGCAQAWPPLLAKGKPSASGGVNTAGLGTTTRSGGSKQVTYMGHPLYYYAGDMSQGQITGQGSTQFGAKWWLVAPSGSAITGAGSTAATSSSGSGPYASGA